MKLTQREISAIAAEIVRGGMDEVEKAFKCNMLQDGVVNEAYIVRDKISSLSDCVQKSIGSYIQEPGEVEKIIAESMEQRKRKGQLEVEDQIVILLHSVSSAKLSIDEIKAAISPFKSIEL